MSSQVIVLQVALLLVVLEADTGLRKIGVFRVARPIIVVGAIVPSYLSSLPTSGHDVLFQTLGAAVGAAVGCLVVSPLFVSSRLDPDFHSLWARWRKKPGRPAIVTHAAWGYAAVWIVICILRLFFDYGSNHIFAHGLGTFLHKNELSYLALTNTLIFFSVAMDLFHSAGLLVRRHSVARRVGPVPGGPHFDRERASQAGKTVLNAGATALESAASDFVDRKIERQQGRGRGRRGI